MSHFALLGRLTFLRTIPLKHTHESISVLVIIVQVSSSFEVIHLGGSVLESDQDTEVAVRLALVLVSVQLRISETFWKFLRIRKCSLGNY